MVDEKISAALEANENTADKISLHLEDIEKKFERIIQFWQNPEEAKNTERRYINIQITRLLLATILNLRQNPLDENASNNSLKVMDMAEKKFMIIIGYYEIAETLFMIELENCISYFKEKKLSLIYRMPRINESEQCMNIIEESTSPNHYSMACLWLGLYYLPSQRYGLPHVPCTASRGGSLDRRRALKHKLDTTPSLLSFLQLNEMNNRCVFCKNQFTINENYVILDCCNHLVCCKCRTRHSWKEWWVVCREFPLWLVRLHPIFIYLYSGNYRNR